MRVESLPGRQVSSFIPFTHQRISTSWQLEHKDMPTVRLLYHFNPYVGAY